MTRIYFHSDSIPKFSGKRLKYGLAITQAKAELWTARTLGYRDWHELLSALGRHPPSPLDEQLPPPALQDRRQYQALALASCFEQEGFAYNAKSVVSQWQPSASRPLPYVIDISASWAQSPLTRWEQAAAGGNADAAFRLAWVLAPDGLRSRYEEPSAPERRAAQLYRQAAQSGHVEAMANLGLFILPRLDLVVEKFEATTWLHRAEQHGEPRAKAYARGSDEKKERMLDNLFAGTLSTVALSAEEDEWIRSVWRKPYF